MNIKIDRSKIVSNAFIYSLLSGGVFSLILLITFFYSIRQKLIIIFSYSYTEVNYKYKAACLILFVIFLRCFVENSIMLFGVDYMILLNCCQENVKMHRSRILLDSPRSPPFGFGTTEIPANSTENTRF